MAKAHPKKMPAPGKPKVQPARPEVARKNGARPLLTVERPYATGRSK